VLSVREAVCVGHVGVVYLATCGSERFLAPLDPQREKFASAYDELKSQGVPEYAVYIKEKDGSEKDWKFVGSMAVPRNTKVELAIYENETNLVKVSYIYREKGSHIDGRNDTEGPG
jgi:hypothetical protein